MRPDGPPGSGPDAQAAASTAAVAALAVPGVAGLHSGMFGEVATYLPGRRIGGVRVGTGQSEVHIIVNYGYDIRRTAQSVRAVVEPILGTPVVVTVEDLVVDVATVENATTEDATTQDPAVGIDG